ncbi:hypothetical protein [Streptomyces fuscigenes]|uniref:hypothetical protein n=1 Tax=Streptomyces fuscigenes TaxID=1528880 RepID=UPI001F39FE1A|nr:hypothetical protein [Streptomyces fuscigenes]MCF3961127.1 hypothetical protein [Streptomyces fuscigenes]
MRRALAVRATGACLAAGCLLVLAPVGATPRGCGDLAGGRLCIEGPIGGAGGFTTRFTQYDGRPAVHVRLGYQRRDRRLTAFAGWFGASTTTDGRAQLSGRLATASDECIRGVLMDPRGKAYVTGWRCAGAR